MTIGQSHRRTSPLELARSIRPQRPDRRRDHRVYTLLLAAEMLGEDAELLWEVYVDMEPEDGRLWVYGPDDQHIPAFTDFGLESLTDFIRKHKANRGSGQNDGR
ncbi:hypothetical protein MPL3365_130550 [Mesorhizobium plurifarium]|uniref:Uncharacterized protein n=1 Tax=Mesorhizobium plurifarium TaxID=69974 RepID=A0A090FX58_MESPL|nr:hypothetical protein MPL3365_130550 [Mesorhizobium plurifarium]